MSTLKTINIQHPSASVPAITLDSAGAMTGSFPYPNRNLLYNGAMQVHQRSTSITGITTDGYYTTDRWFFSNSAMGTWTQTVENDAPTGSGFRKSVKILCTAADSAPAATDYLYFRQHLEGQDLQRIAKGTSLSKELTLSFWVKSNVTGTYIAALYDADNNRSVAKTYTINSSSTWEKEVITFPADTLGVLDNDNNGSLQLYFGLGAGSDRTSGTLQTSWGTWTASTWMSGQINVASSINNFWQITGVQLETGSVATPFEFKSYGQELRECQRYYYRISPESTDRIFGTGWATGTTTATAFIPFPVTMRTRPSAIEQSGTASNYAIAYLATAAACSAVPTLGAYTSSYGSTVNFTVASGLTAGQGSGCISNNAAAYLAWSAEL